MNKLTLCFCAGISLFASAQTDPAIINWLQNTTVTGSYYASGNSTAMDNGVVANCQQVEYSNSWVYVHTHGVPSYPTGPFLDGNPNNAGDQSAIFRISRSPIQNTGTLTATPGGNIGIFINGVAAFDFRDGAGWNTTTNALCGGPGNPPCPGQPGTLQSWNRDAIVAERGGFDCAKGHPAGTNYHHHQNPSAFKLDLNVLSSICNMYDADGLYAIDSTQHSPLLGYSYDGFPIYGAYGYKNADGTGGIVRIRSGYQLRNITTRTTWADGTDVSDGPVVSSTYPLGYFREDYEWLSHPEAFYLDAHNGRFCVTPEYPNGIYCYFTTVDQHWNSAYPYIIGPTYYGVVTGGKVTSVTEMTQTYSPPLGLSELKKDFDMTIYPNPASDIIAVQIAGLLKEDVALKLVDNTGKIVRTSKILAGQTIGWVDVETLYSGSYIIIADGQAIHTQKKVELIH